MDKFFSRLRNIISKLQTNKILILGKGPSIDDYFSYEFKDFFIINLNDSYQFYEGNLILLNKPWALNDLYKLKNNPLILSSISENKINNKNLFCIEEFKNFEFTIQKNKIYRNKPLFLIALEIIYRMTLFNNKKYIVSFLGLDFNFKSLENYTSIYIQDLDKNTKNKKKTILNNQKNTFFKLLKNRNINKKFEIQHIGKLKNSFCNNREFIEKNKQNIYKDKSIRPKVEIVAEVTTNHFGDFKTLIKMVKLIKESGADFVKIQKRDADTFYDKKELDRYYFSKFGKTFRDYRLGLELTEDQLIEFDKYCRKIKIKWFATVLDIKSFKIINKFNPSIIKIPSTISSYKSFHKYLSNNYFGKIVISTGFTTKKYEKYVIDLFKKNKQIYLLQCTSSYPTKNQDCNIGVVKHYSNISSINKKIIPGYSSHDIGSTASIMSVSAGARMIEKHVSYDVKPWAHFDKVAINLKNGEFKKFVKKIRKAEEIYGSEKKVILKSEFHKYKKKL